MGLLAEKIGLPVESVLLLIFSRQIPKNVHSDDQVLFVWEYGNQK